MGRGFVRRTTSLLSTELKYSDTCLCSKVSCLYLGSLVFKWENHLERFSLHLSYIQEYTFTLRSLWFQEDSKDGPKFNINFNLGTETLLLRHLSSHDLLFLFRQNTEVKTIFIGCCTY